MREEKKSIEEFLAFDHNISRKALFSGYVPLDRDPGADPELTGGTSCLFQPGKALGSKARKPQFCLLELLYFIMV